jgi:uncharacterized metal-binding protein
MAEECCATNGNIMILACSGGSNVGQLSNQAAVELTREGFGKMYCLAGVGGLLSGFVQSAKDAPQIVAIDGCSIGCAKAIMEKGDVPFKSYLVVTELGIEKNHDFNLKKEDIDRVKEAVKKSCGEFQSAQTAAGISSASCCS